MPIRPYSRSNTFLFPPNLEELLPARHAVRFVATFVDSLSLKDWEKLGADPAGALEGAPGYAPRVLVSVWLYGFMTRVRSTRKLEVACQEQVPLMWLTGWQRPDHNTLWRFYERHRAGMRALFLKTVWTAMETGLLDLAVQALDGTKLQANAGRQHSYDAAGLERLEQGVDAAIADLEAQERTSEGSVPASLPAELATQQALFTEVAKAKARVDRGSPELQELRATKAQVLQAQRRLKKSGLTRINLTDPQAVEVKSRQGIVAGYNAQAMVSPLDPAVAGRTGLFVTATDVVAEADDHAQLLPLLEQAEANTGQRPETTLADGGYHSGQNLQVCEQRHQPVMMPEAQRQAVKEPYHKTAFLYDATTDTYLCPHQKTLHFVGLKQRVGRPEARIYRAGVIVCRACPAFGTCTRDHRQGRSLEVGPHEQRLAEHRTWMATQDVKARYRQRKQLPEPVFGIMKQQLGIRQFLLRGRNKVKAEWTLLVTAFNLLTLWRVWKQQVPLMSAEAPMVGAA